MTIEFATTDLCDAHENALADGALRVLPPLFISLGRRSVFCGPAATLKVFEDNSLVRAVLETAGNGRVLVVDGGASRRCALVGGNLAQLAERNGWAGIVVDGCVRDSLEIAACDIGVRALALHPRKSNKRGAGESDVPVVVASVPVAPGEWIYADADGILVSRTAIHAS